MTNTASDMLGQMMQTIVSLGKLILQVRPSTIHKVGVDGSAPIIILGNGPSLNQTIQKHLDVLQSLPTMAVNFAANAPIFTKLKPRYYILVDPLFFSGQDLPNLHKLWGTLANVDWDMTLIVPVKCRDSVPVSVTENGRVKVVTINAVGIEGWRWFAQLVYDHALGMPRPRNVLIPAIMSAVQMGYHDIYIVGADHTWMQTLTVNEKNEVVSIQPHFYKEDDHEVKRINTEYMHYPLHQIVHSFYVAFKSYHDIQLYAKSRGINIYNSTPGSMIDAFPRKELPEL